MSTSKLQRHVSFLLNTHFGGYTIRENIRPEWLLSPDDERMELDFYIEELDIAIEVQGRQHFYFTEHFHKDHDGFKQQLERDREKRRKCEKFGLRLFEVASRMQAEELVEKIQSFITPTVFKPTFTIKTNGREIKTKATKAETITRLRKLIELHKKMLASGMGKKDRRIEKIEKYEKKLALLDAK